MKQEEPAERMEEDAEKLEDHSDAVGQHIDEARKDLEQKEKDTQVPGMQAPEEEEGDRPGADTAADEEEEQ